MSAIVREKIKALERKKAQLRRREAQLINDRRHLLLRNALLSGWCEALSLLQIAAFSEEDSSSVDGDAATEQFQLLLKEEIGLLQELTVNEKLSSCSIDDAAQLLPEPDCISPGQCRHRPAGGWQHQAVLPAQGYAAGHRQTSLHFSCHVQATLWPSSGTLSPKAPPRRQHT